MLLDVKNNAWSRKLCEIAGLSPGCSADCGPMENVRLTRSAMEETGLTAATAVIAGAMTPDGDYSSGASCRGRHGSKSPPPADFSITPRR